MTPKLKISNDKEGRTCLSLCEKNSKSNFKECAELIKQKLNQPVIKNYFKRKIGFTV